MLHAEHSRLGLFMILLGAGLGSIAIYGLVSSDAAKPSSGLKKLPSKESR